MGTRCSARWSHASMSFQILSLSRLSCPHLTNRTGLGMEDGMKFNARVDDLSIQILPRKNAPHLCFPGAGEGSLLCTPFISSPGVAIYHWPPRQQTLLLAVIVFPGITTMFAMGQWPSWYELMCKWRPEVAGPWETWCCVYVIISWNRARGCLWDIVWRDACEAIAANPGSLLA